MVEGNVFISSISSLSFLFLFLPCPSISSPLLSLFSLSLGDNTKWPTRVDVNPQHGLFIANIFLTHMRNVHNERYAFDRGFVSPFSLAKTNTVFILISAPWGLQFRSSKKKYLKAKYGKITNISRS